MNAMVIHFMVHFKKRIIFLIPLLTNILLHLLHSNEMHQQNIPDVAKRSNHFRNS